VGVITSPSCNPTTACYLKNFFFLQKQKHVFQSRHHGFQRGDLCHLARPPDLTPDLYDLVLDQRPPTMREQAILAHTDRDRAADFMALYRMVSRDRIPPLYYASDPLDVF